MGGLSPCICAVLAPPCSNLTKPLYLFEKAQKDRAQLVQCNVAHTTQLKSLWRGGALLAHLAMKANTTCWWEKAEPPLIKHLCQSFPVPLLQERGEFLFAVCLTSPFRSRKTNEV